MQYHETKIPDLIDRQVIAAQYTVRDLLADCEDVSIYQDDIDHWLLLEPWSSRENMQRYVQLVKGGTIKPLNEVRVRETAETAIDRHSEGSLSDAIFGQGYMFLRTGKKKDAAVASHGTMIDQIFDYEGAWKFLLPTQRVHKTTMEDWLTKTEKEKE